MDKFQANVLRGFATYADQKEGDIVKIDSPELQEIDHELDSYRLDKDGNGSAGISGKEFNRYFGAEIRGIEVEFHLYDKAEVSKMPYFGWVKMGANHVANEKCRMEDRYGTGWLVDMPIFKPTSPTKVIIPVTHESINGHDLYRAYGRTPSHPSTQLPSELFLSTSTAFGEEQGKSDFAIISGREYWCLYEGSHLKIVGNQDSDPMAGRYLSEHAFPYNLYTAQLTQKQGVQFVINTGDFFAHKKRLMDKDNSIDWADRSETYEFAKPAKCQELRNWIDKNQAPLFWIDKKGMDVSLPENIIDFLEEKTDGNFIWGFRQYKNLLCGIQYRGSFLLVGDVDWHRFSPFHIDQWLNNKYVPELTNERLKWYQEISRLVGHERQAAEQPIKLGGLILVEGEYIVPSDTIKLERVNGESSLKSGYTVRSKYGADWYNQELRNNGLKLPEVVEDRGDELIVKSYYDHWDSEYQIERYPRTEEGHFILKK